MKRADLQRALELQHRIDEIGTALSRCQQGVFKEAFVTVRGAAHGTSGVDGRQQRAETLIVLDVDFVRELLQAMRRDANSDLTRLGVTDE